MAVSAAQVRELRECTGAGMMDCKKALEATDGDIQRAIEELRKTGLARADKKAGRTAAEGIIAIKVAASGKEAIMLDINCETDFVARGEDFLAFVEQVADAALAASHVSDVDALLAFALPNNAGTVDELRKALVAKVGENINIRRFVRTGGDAAHIGTYLHGNRIGVLVELEGGDAALSKDIAMHIAASHPLVVAPADVSAELIEKEKEIYQAQAAASGKPQAIVEKMVEGRLRKYLDEVSLMGQPFVRDPDQTVAALLEKNHAKVLRFNRFEVGEGIGKETENFVEAVMAQVHGS